MDSLKRKRNILDLPLELQKEIFKHSPTSDLISLSLVSKAFREIAAANLYREFHIIFPDDEDSFYESSIDGLASCLDTLVTSDYNYAQYLKSVDFDTLVSGDKAERAYRKFTYDNSCGKFLNTLFLLTLRKTKALERFKWNVRIELSRPVFEALHRIKALKHLHLRLHTGMSLYKSPPPLISLMVDHSDAPGFPFGGSSYIQLENPYMASLAASTTLDIKLMKPMKGDLFSTECLLNSLAQKKIPPTFSGFRDLESLCILDMDSYEYLNEIRECIRNSSSTLHKLKLSFSDALANKSRKQVVENDDDESDADDPFPPTPPPVVTTPGPPTAKAMEDEKKAQEAVLAQIFGLESADVVEEEESGGDEEVSASALSKSFHEHVRYQMSRLVNNVHGPGSRANVQKEVLDALEKAAQIFNNTIGDIEKAAAEATPNQESDAANGTSETAKPSVNEDGKDEGTPGSDPSLFGSTKQPKKDANPNESRPEDIDIEAPEAEETVDWEAAEPDEQVEATEPVSEAVSSNVAEPIANSSKQTAEAANTQYLETLIMRDREMRKYIRETRGLALRTLELYLIPIKASVLSRAIDFKVLTRITLLNVGAQSPFWTLLSKENKSSPLPLSKISTDNVTVPFLNLVSELKCVTELFLLERSTTRQKVESSAPKTTVTKEQIRALALKKHAKTLRKLMIKNDSDYSWDLSEKTIMFLCRKGKLLEELAISCGIKTIHALFQHLNGLKNLHALHIISFRAEDTCVFVIQELRKFAIDIMSCYPDLKLEYIGIIATLAKISRTIKKPGNSTKGKGKGKAKAPAYDPPFSPLGFYDPGMSSSEDEDDESDEGMESGNGVKLEIIDTTLRFCEVPGVRIFRDDVRFGRL